MLNYVTGHIHCSILEIIILDVLLAYYARNYCDASLLVLIWYVYVIN